MKIAVFCSTSDRIDRSYFEKATELGEWMGRNGHILVFGGSNQGLMQCIFEAVKRTGGHTVGVLPAKFEKGGRAIPGLDENIAVPDIPERKKIMLDNSDVAIIMPGGIGTLDELFTTLVDNALGYRSVKVIIYNHNGFWNPLLDLFRHLEEIGMLHIPTSRQFRVVETHDELVKELTKA